MKPPAEIDSCREMVETAVSNLNVEEEEMEEILGRVFREYSDAEEIQAEQFIEIVVTAAYREAGRRDKNRKEYDTKQKEDELRKQKGGMLKSKYPDRSPDKWKAICEESFCRFNSLTMDNKVDMVLCPVCSGELWIEPV